MERSLITSETILLDLLDGRQVNPRPLQIETARAPSSFPVQGWEDVRLFEHDGALHGLATVRDVDDSGLCRMVLLVPAGVDQLAEVVLDSPRPGRHEKNWAPWPIQGAVRAVYSWDPLRVALIDASTGGVGLSTGHLSGLGPTTRGSSGAVELDDGDALFVVHESHVTDAGRLYFHRFVTVDSDGVATRASDRMRLTGFGVEYVAGAARHDDSLLITFGVNDSEAWLARIELSAVLDHLAPLPRDVRVSA